MSGLDPAFKIPPELANLPFGGKFTGIIKDGWHVRMRSQRPQRNDQCLCGSGKKFKRCCWGLFNK
jgi:hypothetical protein